MVFQTFTEHIQSIKNKVTSCKIFNSKQKQVIKIILSRFFQVSDGTIALFEPTIEQHVANGRAIDTKVSFFSALLRRETTLIPTLDCTLWTLTEMVSYLANDLALEFSLFDPLPEGGFYCYRFNDFTFKAFSDSSIVLTSMFHLLLVKQTPFLFNGNPPDETSESNAFGGSDFTDTTANGAENNWSDPKWNANTENQYTPSGSTTLLPPSSEKSKVQSYTYKQWAASPKALSIEQIKEVRINSPKDDIEHIINYLKNMDQDLYANTRVNYTALRLLTNVLDMHELNDLTISSYYTLLRRDEAMLTQHSKLAKKVGKQVSRHYCKIIDLKKNRGIQREFSNLDPREDRPNVFLKFLKKNLNFLIYKITGKIRSFDLPNSCAFDAIRNAYEYNNMLFPESRLKYIVNGMPNLKDKVTYFGIQADTMSYLIDQLGLNINVVDHDLSIRLLSPDNETLPGHIKNLNQHYTYTLDETEYANYTTSLHSEGISNKCLKLNYIGRNPLMSLFTGLGHVFTGLIRFIIAGFGSLLVTGVMLRISAIILFTAKASTLIAGITFVAVFLLFLIPSFVYFMYLLFK